MKHARYSIAARLVTLIGLLLISAALPLKIEAAPTTQTGEYTITTLVAGGEGWIETVEPVNPVPVGAAKHYRIRPARGWMIGDVQIDGRSIGPSMYASIPFVQDNHTITASFVPFDQVQATNRSTKITKDVRILLLGPTYLAGSYLEQLLEMDQSLHFDVTLTTVSDNFSYEGLLGAYYSGRGVDKYLPTIDEGWDYIIPFDLYRQQAELPELHLEGIRLFYNRGWFRGGQPQWILPMSWDYTEAPAGIERATEHAYRIASGFRMPVVPCAIGWHTLVSVEGLPAASTNPSARYAAYNCALMLYAQLVERDASALGFTPAFTNGAFPLPEDEAAARTIERVAWATWQAEKHKAHFSGAYLGNATPFNSNGGRGYHFGTSTRALSVDKMPANIANHDPQFGGLATDGSTSFEEVGAPGSVQNNLAQHDYTYMWRQNKESDAVVKQYLDDIVRGQFGEDPYFIWFSRYADVPADYNASNIGRNAWSESSNAFEDNQDATHNPNRKSRAPQSHLGWGRIWEERTDIRMMEDDLLHATGPVMSMFAAQTYALLTGRDASNFGSWDYNPNSQAVLAEQARYAQRVGFVTIMQAGTLDIHEPYEQSPNDLPVFNPHSIFYSAPTTFRAEEDTYVLQVDESLTVAAPGLVGNDINLEGKPLIAIVKQAPDWFDMEFSLQGDGSFHFIPPQEETGAIRFLYALSDGVTESNLAALTIHVVASDASALAQPGQITNLAYDAPAGGRVTVRLAAGAVSGPTFFLLNHWAAAAQPTTFRFAGHSFSLRAIRDHQELENFVFQQPATFTIEYTDVDVAGLDESQLTLFYYNDENGHWLEDGITVVERDSANNRITFQVAHLTEFALGTVDRLYLPLVGQ